MKTGIQLIAEEATLLTDAEEWYARYWNPDEGRVPDCRRNHRFEDHTSTSAPMSYAEYAAFMITISAIF